MVEDLEMDPRPMDVEGPVVAVREVNHDAAGLVDHVVENQAGDLPEAIWIIDDGNRVVVADDSDESSEEEDEDDESTSEDNWSPDEDYWVSTSDDSGYSSLDEEDVDDEDDIQPFIPLVMRFDPPAVALCIAGPAAPAAPALHMCSFPKRPHEESDVEAQVGTKRQHTSTEDDEQPGPSTSGAGSSTNPSTSGPSPSGLSFPVMTGNWFMPLWSPDDSDSD